MSLENIFINFGGFILKISEILYFEKRDEKLIIALVKTESGEKEFEMVYENEYQRDRSFDCLSMKSNSFAWNYTDWSHAVEHHMALLRSKIYYNNSNIANIEKEIKLLRKQLRLEKKER